MNIPEEAVEAAARSWVNGGQDGVWDVMDERLKANACNQARAALEAAAPYMEARVLKEAAPLTADACAHAWDQGQRAWEDELLGKTAGTNPYRSKP